MTATLTPWPVRGVPPASVSVAAASAPRVAMLEVSAGSWAKKSIGWAAPSTYVTPRWVRTASTWLRVASAMTTPMRSNSPAFRMPVAATASRAAVIEVPCTITVVRPVSPPSCRARKSDTSARSGACTVACAVACADVPTPNVAVAASTLAAQARRGIGRTGSSRESRVVDTSNDADRGRSRPALPPSPPPGGTPRHGRVRQPDCIDPDNGGMTELPRKAAARTARLAALPLGYAGRQAMGFGKRLGGKPADAVLSEVQQRTAEQLFRTLGELKGGAMK